jgi:hypothetical protein
MLKSGGSPFNRMLVEGALRFKLTPNITRAPFFVDAGTIELSFSRRFGVGRLATWRFYSFTAAAL